MQPIEARVYTFSPENILVAEVASGEIVRFQTKDCFSNQISSESLLAARNWKFGHGAEPDKRH